MMRGTGVWTAELRLTAVSVAHWNPHGSGVAVITHLQHLRTEQDNQQAGC